MTKRKIEPKPNLCHFCGKRIYNPPRQSSGWAHGDVFGVSRLIQFHQVCYFEALEQLQHQERA